jgi:hypothetical protein
MKLENKFYSAFFYPFLIGIVLSIIIVAIILSHYSNDYLDKKSAEDIYTIEKKYATVNLNSINLLISNVLLKVQVGLHEQLTFYRNLAAKKTKISIGKNVYNALNVGNESLNSEYNIDYTSIWFVDKNTVELTKKDDVLYQQVAIFSQLTQSLYSVYFSLKDVLMSMYFLFEETNLFIAYPYVYFKDAGLMNEFQEYKNNPTWCTDEKGNIIDYYTFRCRDFFNDIMKSKENMFDNNVNEQPDRKIFVTSPYNQLGVRNSQVIFSLCIEFNDTISNNNAFLCGDINGTNLFDSFDSFNEKLIGYFSITSVGFNGAFYFPQMSSTGYGKTLGEYIFRWDKDYYLEEKLDFLNIIQKNMSSNYFHYIDTEKIKDDPISVFDEIYIDNSDGEEQYFYLDGEKYNYCIFPIILEDYEKKYEHVLSIVYLFNKKLFYQNMLYYQSGASSKLTLQLILFIFFGAVLLYLIVLSFKLLAKFIVIPIKNVQYMLEGINVGGEYRLEYLNDLKKKQEDNLDKLNKINQQILQKSAEKSKQNKQTNTNVNDEKEKEKEKEKNNDNNSNNVLEKSDDINLISNKNEIMSYSSYKHPRLSNVKEKENYSNKLNIENNEQKQNGEIVKINNYLSNNNNDKDNIERNNTDNKDEIKKNKLFSNTFLFQNNDDLTDEQDEIKLKYNKKRNKVSSAELIQKLENFSKKESIKTGNNNNKHLYKVQDELIIIDNENPKDTIFNTIVEEIYTNKTSTKALEYNFKK